MSFGSTPPPDGYAQGRRATMASQPTEEKERATDMYDGLGGAQRYASWKAKMQIMCITAWASKSQNDKAAKIIEKLTDVAITNLTSKIDFRTATTNPFASPQEVFDELEKYVSGGIEPSEVITRLSGLRQGGRRVADYTLDFQREAARALLDQKVLVGLYVAGLAQRISGPLSINNYENLAAAVQDAGRVDDKVDRGTSQSGGGQRRQTWNRGGFRGRGRGRGGWQTSGSRGAQERDMSQVDCYNCGKKGHFARDCHDAGGSSRQNAGGSSRSGARGAAQQGKEHEEHLPVYSDAKMARSRAWGYGSDRVTEVRSDYDIQD